MTYFRGIKEAISEIRFTAALVTAQLNDETERGVREVLETGRRIEAMQRVIAASEFFAFVLPFKSSKPETGLFSELFG